MKTKINNLLLILLKKIFSFLNFSKSIALKTGTKSYT